MWCSKTRKEGGEGGAFEGCTFSEANLFALNHFEKKAFPKVGVQTNPEQRQLPPLKARGLFV